MVQAERGYAANSGCLNDVGRIEPPAKADFDHTGIGWHARKGEECGSGGDFKKARLQTFGVVEHFG